MGRRNRDAVRKWAIDHPAPPPEPDVPTIDDVERVGSYRRRVPYDVDELAASALEMLRSAERATRDGDPGARACFACGHPVKGHGRNSSCACCAKGIRLVPPGTDLMAAALRERRR